MRAICFVIRDLGCGGAQRQLLTLARQVLLTGHEVSLVTFYAGGELEAELESMPRLTHICLHKQGRFEMLRFCWRFVVALRKLRPEVIHGYLYLANILALLAAAFLKPRPKVIWGLRSSNNHLEHYSNLEKLCAWLECRLSRFPDAIISNSHAGYQYALERGFPAARMQVISNGIDTQRFSRSPELRAQLRAAWGIQDRQLLIGIVGRPDPKKGHALFIEAAALLTAQNPAVRFVVVGQGREPYLSQLKALADRLGLAPVLVWAGLHNDMRAVYSALDVLTLCSNAAEGFPNVVGEAMACEVPCVVTRAGDAPLIVGDSGFTLEEPSAQALVACWTKALACELPALGGAARKRVLGEYSVERLAARSTAAIEGLFPAASANAGSQRVKRLLVVVTGLDTGGAEMMLHKLLTRLDRQRFETLLVTLKAGGSLEPRFRASGINVQVIEFSPTRPSWRAFWRGVSLIREFKPDVLLGWMYHACLIVSLWKLAARSPAALFWSVRASAYKQHEIKRATRLVIGLCAKLSRFTRGIIYCSSVAQRQHEVLGYSASKSVFIPNGFDLQSFAPSPAARAQLRSQLGIALDAPVVAVIGRYDPQKDHAGFLKAASIVARTLPATRFLLAGRGVELKNPQLACLVEELGLQQHALLLGERSDIADLLAASDLLVSAASTGEGFPNVLGEAMACGLPCVSTDVGDSRLVLGDCGLIVEPKQPQQLADAILKILCMPEELRQALGMRARERVLAEFEIASVVQRYAGVLR